MAYPNDMSEIAQGLGNLEASRNASYDSTSKEAARNLIRRTYVLRKPAADSMAADTTAYTAADQIRMPRAGRVLGAYIQPASTLTAHDTTYATINVVTGDGAAGAAVVAASQTTKITGGSGNFAAGATEALTVSATLADTRFVAGAVLSFNIAKASTGVVVPACTISVDVEEEDVDGYGV